MKSKAIRISLRKGVIMNKFVKVLSVALAALTITFFATTSFAQSINKNISISNNISSARVRAEIFLHNMGVDYDVSDSTTLKNITGEYEAVAFDIIGKNSNGYIIVNINDLSVPELSLENSNPFKNSENPIYNGALSYYDNIDGNLISLDDNSVVETGDLNYIYHKESISNKTAYIESISLQNVQSNSSVIPYANLERYIPGKLQQWCTDYGARNCGSVAAAICMRYYYDYIDSQYVDSNRTAEFLLVPILQNHIGAPGTTMPNLARGLTEYMQNERSINNSAASATYKYSIARAEVLKLRPCIISTNNHSKYGYHVMTVHGFYENNTDGQFIVVNDTWRANNVILKSDSIIDQIVTFER